MQLADISWTMIVTGLSLFLFGIDYLSNGLKNISQNRWHHIIAKATSHPIKSILIGCFVTCLIQSSSATTAMTIALIRSRVMTFKQSTGIIMGANIGTTMTAFIVGLNISQYAVYFIIAGVVLSLLKKKQFCGQILFGVGCLFYGLELMNIHLQQLSQIDTVNQLINQALTPLTAFMTGIIITGLIQSSSAFIAIVQQLYAVSAIPLYLAIPFLLGSNIGTTVTAVIASFKGHYHEKQAALFHVFFNLAGSLVFMLGLNVFYRLILFLSLDTMLKPAMLLACIHGFFNLVTTIMIYPLIDTMTRIIQKIIPNQD